MPGQHQPRLYFFLARAGSIAASGIFFLHFWLVTANNLPTCPDFFHFWPRASLDVSLFQFSREGFNKHSPAEGTHLNIKGIACALSVQEIIRVGGFYPFQGGL